MSKQYLSYVKCGNQVPPGRPVQLSACLVLSLYGGNGLSDERKAIYDSLPAEIRSLTDGVTDPVTNMTNVAALLFDRLPFSWIGFYRVAGDEMLLGPFQGKPACVRIARGRGVCGTAWERGETLVVPDVHAFEGHIACDSSSRSEVVVPLRAGDGSIWGVLDVDSREPDDFDADDVRGLEAAARAMEEAATL